MSELFQVSMPAALVAGALDGVISVEELLRHGNFGLGTFERLDGEMAIVDGRAFQAKSDGSVREIDGDMLCAFACICRFSAHSEKHVTTVTSIGDLESRFAELRTTQNAFYAFRADGDFAYLRLRAVCRTQGGGLLQAASAQKEFDCANLSGTIIGIWTPPYAEALNVPDFHLHFLSANHMHAGHVLLLQASSLQLQAQRLNELRLRLSEAPVLADADLRVSPEQILRVESRPK